MDSNRVSKFSAVVQKYTKQGTNATTRVHAGEHNGKVRLVIGSGIGTAFGASRTVKQLAHTLSQLNKKKEDKISYEGKVLKKYFTKHLDANGVFKGKMTFGKLQTISEALKKTADDPKEGAQPQAIVGEDKSAEPATKGPSAKTVLNQTSPQKIAQGNWIKKQAGGGKVDRTNPGLGETSKSFLNGQRAVQHYNDLSAEDKASLKTLIDSKHSTLTKDEKAIDAKQEAFSQNAKTANQIQAEHQKRLEDHAKTFPDLMRYYQAAEEDKKLKYKTSEEARKAFIDKLVDIKDFIKDLHAEHNDLEGQDKERLYDWTGSVKKLLNAWEETDYKTLDPKKLGFVDQFCDSAKKSLAEYKGLALENITVKNIEKQKFAKLDAIEEEPMDRLLQDKSLSDAAKGFLLQELARFTHDYPGLKGFEKYQKFISHLILLEANGGVSLDLPPGIPLDILMPPAPLGGPNPYPDFEAFLADQEQKKKPIIHEPSQPLSAKKVRQNTQANAAWNKRVLPYETVIANLVGDPNNRHTLELALMAYAKKKNSVLQLISAKLFGNGSGTNGMINIYAKDPNFSLAFEPVKNVIEEEIHPSLFNQSLSLKDMEAIDRRIDLYVVSKEATLFTDLEFEGQDEDLKNLLAIKIEQLSPKQKGSEELAQKMIKDWYEYKEQAEVQSLMTEAQIKGFLDYLSENYKA